ncbi:hypothetical protein TKK_0002092 [Trichogramma kaykai]
MKQFSSLTETDIDGIIPDKCELKKEFKLLFHTYKKYYCSLDESSNEKVEDQIIFHNNSILQDLTNVIILPEESNTSMPIVPAFNQSIDNFFAQTPFNLIHHKYTPTHLIILVAKDKNKKQFQKALKNGIKPVIDNYMDITTTLVINNQVSDDDHKSVLAFILLPQIIKYALKTKADQWKPTKFESLKAPTCIKHSYEALNMSDISRTFDPMGWLGPTLAVAKILLQDVCLDGSDWDSPVSATLGQRWSEFCSTLPDVSRV